MSIGIRTQVQVLSAKAQGKPMYLVCILEFLDVRLIFINKIDLIKIIKIK